jgi:hypothetical protein
MTYKYEALDDHEEDTEIEEDMLIELRRVKV